MSSVLMAICLPHTVDKSEEMLGSYGPNAEGYQKIVSRSTAERLALIRW